MLSRRHGASMANKTSAEVLAEVYSTIVADDRFPKFPFRDPNWRGLVFNRDKHGAAGLRREVFEAFLRVALHGGEATFIGFLPAVSTDGIEDTSFDIAALPATWEAYETFMRRINFCPEYFLLDASLSWIVWVDSDAVVLGCPKDQMESVYRALGGMECAKASMLEEFGITVASRSPMAVYITALLHGPVLESAHGS